MINERFNYKLYKVEIIKDIPVLTLIQETFARNIVEAEDLFTSEMLAISEYLITIGK